MVTSDIRPPERTLKLFSVFTGFFVASLLLANVTASKIFEVGPFALSAGVIVFPIAFIFGDILTEVYGYELSRKVIWTGFACQILAAVIYLIVGLLPPASFWPHQPAFDQILGFVPRIVIASIAAYFCGEFCNSFILSKMKYWAAGRRGLRQAWRFIASTVVGEAVDTFVVVVIAFAGVYDVSQLVQIGVSVYLFKVLFEIIATPFSIPFANWVKKIEGVDVIDTPAETSYNPFGFSKDSV
jgi:queuosine precursor transporter